MDHGARNPVLAIANTDDNLLISRATFSALVKQKAECRKAYMVSFKIYDVLNKLLKCDDETASSHSVSCFLAKELPITTAPKKLEKIPANTPFSILGCTQIQNAAKLIAQMDQGHGFIDRFLILVPLVLRRTPQQQADANRYIETEFQRHFSGNSRFSRRKPHHNIHV